METERTQQETAGDTSETQEGRPDPGEGQVHTLGSPVRGSKNKAGPRQDQGDTGRVEARDGEGDGELTADSPVQRSIQEGGEGRRAQPPGADSSIQKVDQEAAQAQTESEAKRMLLNQGETPRQKDGRRRSEKGEREASDSHGTIAYYYREEVQSARERK